MCKISYTVLHSPPVNCTLSKCSVLSPAQAARLTNDAPVVGDFNIWSSWKLFLGNLVGLGISVLLTNAEAASNILDPIGKFLRLCVFMAFLWSVSRSRLWLVLKTFDAFYMLGNLLIYTSLWIYHELLVSHPHDPVAKYAALTGQILYTIPWLICIVGIDTVQEHDRFKKLTVTVLSAIFMGWYFIQFRFFVDDRSKASQNVLNQTIDIGVYEAEISVMLAGNCFNLCVFLLKYVGSLLKGNEYTMMKGPLRSHTIHPSVDDSNGAAVVPPVVEGEPDVENDISLDDHIQRLVHPLQAPEVPVANNSEHDVPVEEDIRVQDVDDREVKQ